MNNLMVDYINKLLSGSYNKEGIDAWWERPRNLLGGRTPLQAFLEGDTEQVLALAHMITWEGMGT